MSFKFAVLGAALCLFGITLASDKLENGDFEYFDERGKTIAWRLPSKFRVIKGEGSNGSHGLVYENLVDSSYYETANQKIELDPGSTYRFGGWVRVDKISGKGGIAIVLLCFDKNGKWLGETWTKGIRKPTSNWVKCESSATIKQGTAFCRLGFVIQRGVLARVSLDKVFVTKYVRKPIVGVYSSAYRNEASEGKVRFAASLSSEVLNKECNKASLCFEVSGGSGNNMMFFASIEKDHAKVEIPVDVMTLGTNSITCILCVDGKEFDRERMTFIRTQKPTRRNVVIDNYGRTVVNGKPFFPIGMYSGSMTAESVKKYAESDFNCIMQYSSPTRAQMNLFEKAGLKVIYDIASKYNREDAGTNFVLNAVKAFGNHPALLAWYIYDEQPTSLINALEGRQRLIESVDPNHPTWCAQDIFSETRYYIGACDIFGGDPYPISKRPISVMTDAIREETQGLMGMRPIWQVVQAFGWGWVQNAHASQRRPSEIEMRNMAWQAIAGGARGLIFYNFKFVLYEIEGEDSALVRWEELKRISTELKKYERLLLFSETIPIDDSSLPIGVVGREFRNANEIWRLLVNITNQYKKDCGLEPFEFRFDRVSVSP